MRPSTTFLIPILFLIFLSTKCQSDQPDFYIEEPEQELQLEEQVPASTTTKQNVDVNVNGNGNGSASATSENNQNKVGRPFAFDVETMLRHPYQMGAIAAILLYVILYRIGKNQNIQAMEQFYNKVSHFFDKNFSHIGFTKNSGENPFVSESPNQAMYYATGRNNVEYVEIKLNMVKRQDFLYHYVYELFMPEKDLITIDVPVKSDNPVVLCVAQSKKLKSTTQKHLDLAKLAGSFNAKGLNNTLKVLAESEYVLDLVLDPSITKKLNEISPIIQSIHYTDQKTFSESTGHIRAVLALSPKHSDKYLPAVELIFQLADKIHDLKLSANYKQQARKSRQAFNSSVQKQKMQKHQQDLRKKKQEKRKQEEAWLRSLPADKQKRQDEKRKKKQINKLLKSKMVKA